MICPVTICSASQKYCIISSLYYNKWFVRNVETGEQQSEIQSGDRNTQAKHNIILLCVSYTTTNTQEQAVGTEQRNPEMVNLSVKLAFISFVNNFIMKKKNYFSKN